MVGAVDFRAVLQVGGDHGGAGELHGLDDLAADTACRAGDDGDGVGKGAG